MLAVLSGQVAITLPKGHIIILPVHAQIMSALRDRRSNFVLVPSSDIRLAAAFLNTFALAT